MKKLVGTYAFHYLYDYIINSRSIGLGTGSTIKYFIDELLHYHLLDDKAVYVSSIDTLLYLGGRGVKAYTPLTGDRIDLYVDGFDEGSERMDLVKGRGAALLWEKQLALRSRLRVYIADYTKYNGRNYLYLKPVPIEVVKPALHHIVEELRDRGYRFRVRMGRMKDGPVITDTGNFIIDLYMDRIDNPEETDQELKGLNGVIETGLFPNKLVDIVMYSYPDGVVRVYEAKSL